MKRGVVFVEMLRYLESIYRQLKDAIFPAYVYSASALPCETGNTEIVSFHFNAC